VWVCIIIISLIDFFNSDNLIFYFYFRHCKRFAPTYDQVAIKLHSLHASTNRKVMVGRVNGAAEKALASRFSITKYPSFFLLDGWTIQEYEGNRLLDNLIDFATKSYKKYEVNF